LNIINGWLRSPKVVFGLAVSTIFIILFVAAGTSYALSVYAVDRATSNAVTLTELCQSGNDFRTDQITLWKFIVNLNRQPRTPAEQEAINRFYKYVQRVFKLRDCSKVTNQP
jgi:hypothetical protein